MRLKKHSSAAAGVVLFFSSVFAAPATAGQSPPSWVLTGGIKQFPAELFITGMGSADVVYGDTAAAQAEADSMAISQVAKQIKVKIRQLSQSFERETATGQERHRQYDVWQKTAAFIDISVEGVRIEDRYYDQKTNRLYSLAMLDRLAQGRVLAQEAHRLENSAAALIQEARNHLNRVEKIHRSVVGYRLATTKLLMALRKHQYLKLIAPQLVQGGIAEKLSQLQADLSRVSSKFSIQPVSGDRQSTTIGGHLNDPLTVQVTYANRPAPSVPIRFDLQHGTGHLDSQSVTDVEGMASTLVGNLGPTGKKINKIRVTIGFFPKEVHQSRSLQALVPPVATQFTYFLPAVEDIRIAVLIRETNMGYRQAESVLANLLKRELNRLNFRVIDDLPPVFGSGAGDLDPGWNRLSVVADIAVAGEVQSRLAEDSYSPSLVFTLGRAVVQIVDLKRNTELSTVDVAAKSAGPSREASGRRVIEKTSQQAAAQIVRELRRRLVGAAQ